MKRLTSLMFSVILALSAAATPWKTASGAALSALPGCPPQSAAASFSYGGNSPLLSPLTQTQVRAARLRAFSGVKASGIAESVPDLRGWIIWPAGMMGLYTLPRTSDSNFAPVGTSSYGIINGGGYDDGHGTYHGVYYEIGSENVRDLKLIDFDSETFDITDVRQLDPSTDLGMVAMDIDVDPTTGDVYGCYMTDNASGYCWGRGDYSTARRTLISNIDFSSRMVAVACDARGQYYALTASSALVKVDKASGAITPVGQTSVPSEGFLAGYTAGGAIDKASDKMYVTYITPDSESGIYEIDLATAESRPVVDFKTPAMVVAPFFVSENTSAVPAVPGFSVTAPEGTLTASYVIEMPSKLENGKPASGQLDWELYLDGALIKSGKALAGTKVTGTYTLAAPAMCRFSAVVANAAGKSLQASASLFVGNGLPATPANVEAKWADGKMTVKWDAVSTTVDGGYMDADAVTYKVMLGETVVAQSVSATNYQYPLALPSAPKSFVYSVVAVNKGIESQPGTSNTLWLGAYETPFTTDFSPFGYYDKLEDIGYTVVDVNKDGCTWGPMGMGKGIRYKYSSANAADDWVITPSLRLEAGKVYNFSAFVSNYGASDEERFEVKAGMGASADAMTLEVIPATTVNNTAGQYVAGIIAPTVSGSWNVGIHCISDPYKYYLIVRDLSVGKGMLPSTPNAVTDIVLTPEASGLLNVSGKFRLPTTDVVGKKLLGNVTVKVSRGETAVATLSGAPGAELTFTDNNIPVKGDYTYTVTTTLNGADGVVSSASVFVGPYAAAAPKSVTVTETDRPGRATVTWDAVTQDINGRPISAENVKYMVYSVVQKDVFDKEVKPLLDAPISELTATVDVLSDASVQQFAQVSVVAYNRDAESDDCVSDLVALGNPYAMPVTYSGTDSQGKYIERISSVGTGFWSVYDDKKLADAPKPFASSDYYGCYGGAAELYGDLYTGKIDLTTARNPEVSFYTYKFPANHKYFMGEDVNFIEVIALVDNKMTLVGTAHHANMVEGRWNKVRMDLSKYKGKSVQLIFRGVTKTGYYTLLDEMTIKDLPAKDMATLYIDAPAKCAAAMPFEIVATVANEGYETSSAFKARLFRDGALVDERAGDALASGKEADIVFRQQISYFDANSASAKYMVEVVMDGDEDASNNMSEEVEVIRVVPDVPAVTDLKGVSVDGGNRLTWTKYTTETLEPKEMTEDFEEATPWELEYADWTFLSESSSPVAHIYGYEFPGITAYETKLAWVVVNNLGVEDQLSSVSGKQFIASLCKNDKQANNDWAISPLLFGGKQTISFWAKSVRSYYPELFEVYVSYKDSTDPADYVKISGDAPVSPSALEWEQFRYNLPEGALHFAVRCVSADCYILMLDDFTFTPDPLLGAPVLIGYDVYRDGMKINAETVADGEYLDATADADAAHTYHVVAKYSKGDSELSNAVRIESAGIADGVADSVSVYADGESIVVDGAADAPVAVCAIDGRVVYRGNGDCRVAVSPAVYVVTVGGTAHKLIVR